MTESRFGPIASLARRDSRRNSVRPLDRPLHHLLDFLVRQEEVVVDDAAAEFRGVGDAHAKGFQPFAIRGAGAR